MTKLKRPVMRGEGEISESEYYWLGDDVVNMDRVSSWINNSEKTPENLSEDRNDSRDDSLEKREVDEKQGRLLREKALKKVKMESDSEDDLCPKEREDGSIEEDGYEDDLSLEEGEWHSSENFSTRGLVSSRRICLQGRWKSNYLCPKKQRNGEKLLRSSMNAAQTSRIDFAPRTRLPRNFVYDRLPKFPKEIMNDFALSGRTCSQENHRSHCSCPKKQEGGILGEKFLIASINAAQTSRDDLAPRPRIPRNYAFDRQLELPDEFKTIAEAVGHTEPVLVIQKKLSATDVNKNHNRLSIPGSQVRTEFLNEDEKALIEAKEDMVVQVIDPMLTGSKIMLKKWDMKKKKNGSVSSMYVLNNKWNCLVERNKLREGDDVQLWAFRMEGEICLVIVKIAEGNVQRPEENEEERPQGRKRRRNQRRD